MAAPAALAGVQYKEGERRSVRGTKLFSVEYHPEQGRPSAALVFHHGLAEHIGRYTGVFTSLARSGIACYSEDALGHGKSEGERAYIERLDDLVEDFTALADYARGDLGHRYGQLPPIFLCGHSMGALIASLVCTQDQSRWAGLVLLSAALDLDMTLSLRVQVAVGSVLARIAPHAHVVKAVRPEDMSADAACVNEYIADPLITKGALAARTASEIIKAYQKLRPQYATFTLPLYVLHGDADKCTSLAAARRFAGAAASKDKTLKIVPGGYHELILGPGSQEQVSELVNWILVHSTPAVHT